MESCFSNKKKKKKKDLSYTYLSGARPACMCIISSPWSTLSLKLPICKCGAVKDLTSPVFCQPHKHRPYSSVAAVGPVIYVFGGMDLDNSNVNDCTEVSYINTLRPLEGWKLCKEQMPRGGCLTYPITLDDGKVLLLGGLGRQAVDPAFAQMYHSSEDHWVPLKSLPVEDSVMFGHIFGHAVVKEEGSGETMVLMHGVRIPFFYTYNVTTNSWGTRWDDGLKTHCISGAFLNGIYYVVDVLTSNCVVLCGYDIHSDQAKCLSVEIRVDEDDDRMWVPLPDHHYRWPWPTLLPCGDTKLAMIWNTPCYHDKDFTRLSFYWSIFEMTKEPTDDMPRLVAHPLYQVCYHIDATMDSFNRLLPLYLPKSPTTVLRSKKKGEKQNKVAPVDSKKDKMRPDRKLQNLKESPSESGVSMNNIFECLACGDDEDGPTGRGK